MRLLIILSIITTQPILTYDMLYNVSHINSLKLLLIRFHVPTNRTPKCKLLSIRRMFNFQLAFLWIAFRQLVLRVLTHVISSTLSLMTILTEVRCSPTKPRRDLTTELALILNEVFSM